MPLFRTAEAHRLLDAPRRTASRLARVHGCCLRRRGGDAGEMQDMCRRAVEVHGMYIHGPPRARAGGCVNPDVSRWRQWCLAGWYCCQ